MNKKNGSREVIDADLIGSNLDNFRTMFYETANGKYVPKALFIDTERGVTDALQNSSIGGILHPDFVISGYQDCRNIIGLGWHHEYLGSSYHANVKDQCRRVYEQCESVSGTMYFMSSCGGTGTGVGARCLQYIKEIDSKNVSYAHLQTPSPSICSNPLETKNTLSFLGITRNDELDMNMLNIYDNEALYRQARKIHKRAFSPTFAHLNQLIALTVSSCTASLRFDGQLNVDLNEFQTNLVPIPTLNYVFQSFGPVLSDQSKESMATKDITLQAFSNEAFQCSVAPFAFANKFTALEAELEPAPWLDEANMIGKNAVYSNENQHNIWHKFLGCCVMYRGDLMPATINRAMRSLNQMRKPEFVSWVPTGFKVGINSPPLRTPLDWPVRDMARSVTCIMNNTAIVEKLKQLCYNHVRSSESYSSWVTEGKFSTALLKNCYDSVSTSYRQYHWCMCTTKTIDEIKEELASRPTPIPDGSY